MLMWSSLRVHHGKSTGHTSAVLHPHMSIDIRANLECLELIMMSIPLEDLKGSRNLTAVLTAAMQYLPYAPAGCARCSNGENCRLGVQETMARPGQRTREQASSGSMRMARMRSHPTQHFTLLCY